MRDRYGWLGTFQVLEKEVDLALARLQHPHNVLALLILQLQKRTLPDKQPTHTRTQSPMSQEWSLGEGAGPLTSCRLNKATLLQPPGTTFSGLRVLP